MLEGIVEFLFTDIVIHRNIFPFWYTATGLVLIVAIVLAFLLKLKKFGFWILISAAAMSTIWEVILFSFGLRDYNNPLAQMVGPIPELIYHSFSETAATFLLGLLIIYKLGIIDLEKFKDYNWDKRKKKTLQNEKGVD